MKKEDKIKEAWDETGIKVVSYNEYGWAKFSMDLKKDPCYDSDLFDFTSIRYFRPKSLKGIENNNGWIKIDSEDDIPEKAGHYWVCYKGVSTFIIQLPNKNQISDSIIKRLLENYTHYSPILIPEKPMY